MYRRNAIEVPVDKLHDVFECRPDEGRIFWKRSTGPRAKVGSEAGTREKDGYVRVSLGGRKIRRHRVIWAMVHGEWPACDLDHVNGLPGDDRVENLRLATSSQNQANQKTRVDSKTGIKGVTYDPKCKHRKFRAHITLDGKSIHVGSFKTADEAKDARDKMAELLHGEYARSE